MPLTDTAIRAAKPSEKQQKLFDGSGLYLLVFPSGSKVWRFKYHYATNAPENVNTLFTMLDANAIKLIPKTTPSSSLKPPLMSSLFRAQKLRHYIEFNK